MKRYLFILLAALMLGSCSLLKFTMDTGDVPLTSQQVNMRVLTRAFYKDFSTGVVTAADSIYRSTDSLKVKVRAINWKISSTSLCADAALSSVPEISLLNTWILCSSMDRHMAAAPDSALFGAQSDIARQCARQLHEKMENIAAKSLPHARFEKMKEFVQQNSDPNNPPAKEDMTLKWIAFLGIPDSTYVKSTGSVAQSIGDLNDKMSGYSSQWGSEFTWNKELLLTHMAADGTASDIRTRMDSIQMQFGRITTVLENTPDIAATVLDELNGQVTQIIRTINVSVNNAFSDIDHQRAELQSFIDSQRVHLMAQADSTANHAVRTAMDALPSMLGSLMLYAVLAFVVMFSIPFVLGFFIGKYRGRKTVKNQSGEGEDDDDNEPETKP